MSEPTFLEMARAELELCGIGEGSTVAVLSQGNERIQYVDTFLLASEQLGATAFHVRLPNQDGGLDGDVLVGGHGLPRLFVGRGVSAVPARGR